jgi:hypothetical protein
VRAATRSGLVRDYRDKALYDRDDHNCGIVDDIEAEEREPGVWQMTALLVGPGAWSGRRPHWMTRLLPGRRCVRVVAGDVAGATSVVRLLRRAEELGLASTKRNLLAFWRHK